MTRRAPGDRSSLRGTRRNRPDAAVRAGGESGARADRVEHERQRAVAARPDAEAVRQLLAVLEDDRPRRDLGDRRAEPHRRERRPRCGRAVVADAAVVDAAEPVASAELGERAARRVKWCECLFERGGGVVVLPARATRQETTRRCCPAYVWGRRGVLFPCDVSCLENKASRMEDGRAWREARGARGA